jgi:hypothetical protein
MNNAVKTLERIDGWLEDTQEREHRKHLGASVIGEECMRKSYYIFRWAKKEAFGGRMLRLFGRGHLEEPRFMAYLRGIGCEVWETNPNDIDPKTGQARQWRVTDLEGHFGGSLDGVGRGIPDLPPNTPFLIEAKTHNDKSFKDLLEKGVMGSKWKHFVQAQMYMHKKNLKWCLYMAVNKNDDDLYLELIPYNEDEAVRQLEKGRRIIFEPEIPPRISEKANWFKCTFCSFREICHYREVPEINCRTCIWAQPAAGGTWVCGRHDGAQRSEIQDQRGCNQHIFKPDLLNGARLVSLDALGEYAEVCFDNKDVVKLGPKHYSSLQLQKNGYPPF